MESANLFSFLMMGLGLGVLHAFDPDHLAAVGGMASGSLTNAHARPPIWQFALRWSIGHSGMLLLIAIAVFILGVAIPQQLSQTAEQAVAYMLILIGGWGVWKAYKYFKHADDHHLLERVSHTSAWCVGAIHGTAGSAPLLTLIPLSQLHKPMLGLVYVVFFSGGVLIAMTGIGHSASRLFQYIAPSNRWRLTLQLILAGFSVAFGIYLLLAI